MFIDWESFTPLASLVGGILIGVAVSMFVLLNERIAGISGILGGLLRSSEGDLAGRWDPSLAFVMVGAIALSSPAFLIAVKRGRSFFGPMHLPTSRDIDRRLVLGGLTFGVGWGLAGFCPGPALVALGAGTTKAVVFVAAMLAGMRIFEAFERRSQRVPPRAPTTGSSAA